MVSLKVYQIGLGSFGRFGFEKLVEMHNHLEEVDVQLVGLCERDFDKLEAAEKFAAANGIDLEVFHDPDEMYREIPPEDNVMVYDAGPADTHSGHIYQSLQNGFFHLTEKPPSMTREEHLKEKKLAEQADVFYKVDFIERESPVVKKTLELLEGEVVDSVRVFRESSVGSQKVLQPVERLGVKGGDILDKMVHEIYVLDFIQAAGVKPEIELENAHAKYFMPYRPESDRMMNVEGSVADSIDNGTATATTKAVFDISGARVEFNSSWLGVSQETQKAAERVEDVTGSLIERGYRCTDKGVFLDEEARFYIVEGSRNLVGDLLHGRLYDLDTGEEIGVPALLHDQIYRVIEKAVLSASGDSVDAGGKTDMFINAVFDVKDEVIENADSFIKELERSNERLSSLLIDDLEDREEAAA